MSAAIDPRAEPIVDSTGPTDQAKVEPEFGPDLDVEIEVDVEVDVEIDAELDQELDIGEAYPFECTTVELFSGTVRVGDDIDPSRIIEHATRYTTIAVESAEGGRAIDIWRTAELAVVHEAAAEDPAPGIVLSQRLLELHVATFVTAAIGQLKPLRGSSTEIGDDDSFVLLIGSGSPGDEGPKAGVVNTPESTMGGVAGPGIDNIEVEPVSAVTAWAMIVEALRSEAPPSR